MGDFPAAACPLPPAGQEINMGPKKSPGSLLRNPDVESEGSDGPAAIPQQARSRPSSEDPISTYNKATLASRTLLFTKIIAAIAQYITAAIVLGGKSLTPQALSAMFQSYLQAESDLEAARLVVAERQQARDAAYAPLVGTLPALEKYLAAQHDLRFLRSRGGEDRDPHGGGHRRGGREGKGHPRRSQGGEGGAGAGGGPGHEELTP
jgi:hypothetical protein